MNQYPYGHPLDSVGEFDFLDNNYSVQNEEASVSKYFFDICNDFGDDCKIQPQDQKQCEGLGKSSYHNNFNNIRDNIITQDTKKNTIFQQIVGEQPIVGKNLEAKNFVHSNENPLSNNSKFKMQKSTENINLENIAQVNNYSQKDNPALKGWFFQEQSEAQSDQDQYIAHEISINLEADDEQSNSEQTYNQGKLVNNQCFNILTKSYNQQKLGLKFPILSEFQRKASNPHLDLVQQKNYYLDKNCSWSNARK
ncbi:hypothetical protein FGO68_gene1781 [Halteria grandinella]|uniref:Uncharacterized protein n=1 Tax=Halteria grandinella TaxID=5974 RepID=A0A8J8P1A8_HALGN|nr:hypothetical protein FGO68_gene1781 [Halteria grandinella]